MSSTTCKPLRWGIIGCGRISQDFVLALDHGKYEHQVSAVATSSSVQRAKEFIQKLYLNEKSTQAYGSYTELLDDPNVDIVYIGNLNDAHYPCTLAALDKGKHVLCEKPLAISTKQVQEMFQKAKEKQLFLMEALWSRFFPGWKHIRDVVESKEYGAVKMAYANFGIQLPSATRFHTPTGETPLMDVGVYVVMFCLNAFGCKKPESISVVGHKNSDGSDTWGNITLDFGNQTHGICYFNGQVNTPNSAYICLEKGQIQLPDHFWCPTKLLKLSTGDTNPEVLQFPLSPRKSGGNAKGDFLHSNSEGLSYQADHVFDCLAQRKLKSDVMSPEVSILLAEVIEEVRHKMGVVFPQDTA